MTPVDLDQIRKMIDGAIDKAIVRVVQPIQEQIDGLINNEVRPLRSEIEERKRADERHDAQLRKHSGTHKGLADDVRRTGEQAKADVDELARQAIEKLLAESEIAKTARQGTEAAAVAGAQAALDTKRVTIAMAIDGGITRAAALATKKDGRIRMVMLVAVFVATMINHLKGCT